jgi:hypothetical protein
MSINTHSKRALRLAASLAVLAAPILAVATAPSASGAGRAAQISFPKCGAAAAGSLGQARTFGVGATVLAGGRVEGLFDYHDGVARLDLFSAQISSLVVDKGVAWMQGVGTVSKSRQTVRFSLELGAASRSLSLRLTNGYAAVGTLVRPNLVGLVGTCPFTGSAAIETDDAAAATASIGRDGGAITAGGVTLAIPAGALSENRQITVTPLTALRGSPLDGGLIAGARLQPDGLALLKPAKLSFALPAGTGPADVVGFGFEGAGADLHLTPSQVDGGRLELDVWHFSGAGGSFGRYVNGFPTWIPGSAETRAEHEIAQLKLACERATLASPGVFPPECDLDVFNKPLATWYQAAVEPGLKNVTAPSFEIEPAFEEWLRWGGRVNSLIDPAHPDYPAALLASAHALATTLVAELAVRRLNNCTGTDPTSQLRDVYRVVDFVVEGVIDLETATLASGQPAGLPGVNLLGRTCIGIVIDAPEFPSVVTRDSANKLVVHAHVQTYTGPLGNVPLVVSLVSSNGHVDPTGGPLDAQGRFEADVYPAADASLIAVDMSVRLDAGAFPGLPPQFRQQFEQTRPVGRPTEERMVVQGPGTVKAGQSGAISVKLNGDTVSGQTIGFSISAGQGTLSATSAATDANGEAAATFNAPAGANGSATVDVTFQDGASFLKKQVVIALQDAGPFVVLKGGTLVRAQEYDRDENLICCSPIFLAVDTPPPVALTLPYTGGGTTMRIFQPAPSTLALAVDGTAFDDNTSDAEVLASAQAAVGLSTSQAFTLRADINTAWRLIGGPDARFTVVNRATGEELLSCGADFFENPPPIAIFGCTGAVAGPTSVSVALPAGSYEIDAHAGLGGSGEDATRTAGTVLTFTIST